MSPRKTVQLKPKGSTHCLAVPPHHCRSNGWHLMRHFCLFRKKRCFGHGTSTQFTSQCDAFRDLRVQHLMAAARANADEPLTVWPTLPPSPPSIPPSLSGRPLACFAAALRVDRLFCVVYHLLRWRSLIRWRQCVPIMLLELFLRVCLVVPGKAPFLTGGDGSCSFFTLPLPPPLVPPPSDRCPWMPWMCTDAGFIAATFLFFCILLQV